MHISDDEFRALKKRVDDLDKHLDESRLQSLELFDLLTKRLDKVANTTLLQDSLLGKICNSIESMGNCHSDHNEEFEVLFNAYDMVMTHIENLEAKVFPNLQSDLRKLHRVIGRNEAVLANPLDRRQKEPPKKD